MPASCQPRLARSARLALAKARAGRRASQEGAVIFVVVLTLAVLAAIGAWALQSAAIEIRTAGYERQSTQTHYLSEFGALMAMQDMNPGGAQALFNKAYCNPNTCITAPTAGVSAPNRLSSFCLRLGSAGDVGQYLSPPVAAPVLNYDAGAPNSPGNLGAIPMNGDFWVEITEAVQTGSPAGFSVNNTGGSTNSSNGQGFYQMTLTAAGVTQQQAAATNTSALWGSEGLELQRVRIVAGPLTPPSSCK